MSCTVPHVLTLCSWVPQHAQSEDVGTLQHATRDVGYLKYSIKHLMCC